jgi:PilZ domain
VGPERRRDVRCQFRLPGAIVRRDGNLPVLAGDVGFRGVLLRTDAPPPLRQLLLLRFELPPEGEVVELHAMAVWNVPPGLESRTPGVGVQLYAVPPATQRRWNEFVRWVARTHPESKVRAVPVSPGVIDPVRRLHERVAVELLVRLTSPARAGVLSTTHVSRRGLFLRLPEPLEAGQHLGLELLHPSTGAPLPVSGVVRYADDGSGRGGVGVEFLEVDERRRDAVMAYVAAALGPGALDDAVYLSPDDPRLGGPPLDDDPFFDVDLSDG